MLTANRAELVAQVASRAIAHPGNTAGVKCPRAPVSKQAGATMTASTGSDAPFLRSGLAGSEPDEDEGSGAEADGEPDRRAGPVIFLMGPTAAGKTEVAAALVERGPYDIVSVDSALVFRHLDIGTGKPDCELLARAPHRLIDLRNPDERYSAGEFRDDASSAIAAIRTAGRIPLLVGGTGLYFRALERGLAVLPPADAAVRAEIERDAARAGWPAMHGRLARLDPSSASRIHPNDPQRIERALEVHALTGRPMSELLVRGRRAGLAGPVCRIVIEPADRALLHRDIAARFMRMLETGLIDEVMALKRCWPLTGHSPSMRLVGYRQAWAYLEGQCSYEEMASRAIAATRQLARRQLTWLRSDQGAVRVDCHAPDAVERVAACAEAFVERAAARGTTHRFPS